MGLTETQRVASGCGECKSGIRSEFDYICPIVPLRACGSPLSAFDYRPFPRFELPPTPSSSICITFQARQQVA